MVLILFLCISSVVAFLVYFQETNVASQSEIVNQTSTGEIVSQTETWKRISVINGTKNILLWKNAWGFRFELGRAAFLNSGCRVTNCLITYNNTLMTHDKFDAFVIHSPTQHTPWILKDRRPDQMFVMFTTEPPPHMPKLDKFEKFFNWTMTYRSGSTFQLKYGEIVPLETAPTTEQEAEAMRLSIAQSGLNPAKGKTKLAIWLVSNCNARSNRQGYVKILKNYMDVDIFSKKGKCGGQDVCPREKNSGVCYDMIEKTYKFYFSFENSICEEYVTEKFFEMMGRNIVPVVLGGADYSAIAPPHSYISALDYTPKQLAKYLKELDSNDTLYAEYFWWKPHYRIRNLYDTNRKAFCDLCEALHTSPIQTSIAKGLNQWYHKDAKCRHNPKFDET
ncbi:alpha-(1,3)-fucosyltransferase C-like [Daphnia pulex]|uniref:alpha-(1,3)-fucosyltransferase C-like n=1 Tax=Daphnia pulex TaxID=6669 RepID=UPI001EDFCD53|nr:alpha-(1,3)-fucosyltransferase C-like [Daphnia pulex]